MANDTLSLHFHPHEQRVLIAVGRSRDHTQPVPRSFPFHPKLISGAAVEGHVPFLDRQIQSFAIHEPHHQDFTR